MGKKLSSISGRVAIVGCGMGGPALATLLARAGAKVTVFERAPTLGPIGAGILLQPTGMAALDRLGLLKKVRTFGRPVHRLDARTAGGRQVWELRYGDLPEFADGGLGVHRGALFTILLDAVIQAGVEVRAGCEIRSVRANADGRRELRDASGQWHGPFDLVVMASGGRTDIAVDGSPPRTWRAYRWGAWWASVPDRHGLFPDALAQWYRGTTGLLGILPTGWLPGQEDAPPLVSLFWSVRSDRAHLDRDAGIDVCRAKMQALSPAAEPILRELRDFSQMTLAVYGEARMPRWSDGRVVWLGDAAHAMSPHLGQGTNLAFLDAVALTDALATSNDWDIALASFERVRRKHTLTYQFVSRWMMPFFQCAWSGPGWLRDLGMPLLCAVPWLRKQMLTVLAGVHVGLRGKMPLNIPKEEAIEVCE